MFDIIVQLLKMVVILSLWYFMIYEVPKQEKDGMFHSFFDSIQGLFNLGKHKSETKRGKTTFSRIWIFIDKFLLTVPGTVIVILESSKWFSQAANDLMIVLQNLAN